MGLDMYAYSIRADLIGDEQVDILPFDKAIQQIGFQSLTEDEFLKLDEDAKKTYHTELNAAVTKAKEQELVDADFAYWRKFNHLHGWMEQLYEKKGGKSPTFNCATVRITAADLDRLESLASLKAMVPAEGFFFGSYEPFDDEDRSAVLAFVKKAREAIKNGRAIVYDSWW